MSDPIAQAAEALSAAPATGIQFDQNPAIQISGNVLVNETPVVVAPVVEGNVDTGTSGSIVPAISSSAPSINSDANAGESGSQATGAQVSELPRESHLMLLEHKLAAMHAKFRTGERIVIDEFEQILGHIRAVL